MTDRETTTRRSIARATRRALTALAGALVLAASAPALAQDSPIPTLPAEGTLDAEQIDSAIEKIRARDDLADETRAEVVQSLQDAKLALVDRRAAESAARTFAESFQNAPLEAAQLRATLDDTADAVPELYALDTGDDVSLGALEQVLARESAAAANAAARLTELETAIVSQQDRPAAIRARIAELQSTLEQLTALQNAQPAPGVNALVTAARRLKTVLLRDARRAERIRLEQELLSYDVRLELLRARRDAAAAAVDRAIQRVEQLQSMVNRERQAAARRAQVAAAEAELAAADKHPALRAIAEGNLALTRELPSIAERIERATSRLSRVREEIQQIEQAMTRARQRLDIGGITQTTGRLFVQERRNLPRYSDYRSEVRDRRKTLSSVGLAQIRIEEQRRDLTPIEARLDTVMEAVRDDVTDPESLAAFRDEAAELLRARRELLSQASGTYRTYVRLLGDLDAAQRQLLASADAYREFLDKNLIWIPNSAPVNEKSFADALGAAAWVLSPQAWLGVAGASYASVAANPLQSTLALALLLMAVALQPRLKRWYQSLNTRIGKLSTDGIVVTFASLAIAAVRALPLPLLLAIAGWSLQRSPEPTDFVESVAAAFLATAPFLYNLLLFRVLAGKGGILRTHFDWREENLESIRRQLDRVIVVGVPLAFVTVMSLTTEVQSHRDGLGRLAFTALMLLFAAVLWPLGHPKRRVGATYYHHHPDTWLSRLKWLWFGLDLGIPISLAALALIGYVYTALNLVDKAVATLWLVLGLALVSLVIRRWLALEARKIEWQQALEQREAKRAGKDADAQRGETTSGDSDGELSPVQSAPLELDAIGEQTRKLLRAALFVVGIIGAWSIWSDVVPALKVLDEVSLWTQTITVDGAETVAPVSLADVLLALVIAVATFVAARNLPGLMEIAVLRHLDLQPGGRYTINTLLRYLLITIGVATILNIIGWNWSRIQWLVAALSVGLGFGLQEIVANFVSGLIILFERPVRVGDTVTVGQLTGTVSKVRIRATTITDWDRKEIIVPNKAFITEQVVNWTLSDPITRVVVPVGISYGSDIELATTVMKDTLLSMPIILDEPPPAVYFMGFGDSSLNFKLYVFSRQLSDRLPLMHAVHSSILEALREHGIQIPFPQRDLHLRSISDDVKPDGWGPPAPEKS